MYSVTSTIFLPPNNTVFGIHPDQLEEEHRTNCIVLRAKELNVIYLIGGHIVDAPVEWDWHAETLEIYYTVSDMIRAHVFCVRMEMFSLPHAVDVVVMNMLPPGLVPLEALDLPARYGRAFRPQRFQPRLLPVSV